MSYEEEQARLQKLIDECLTDSDEDDVDDNEESNEDVLEEREQDSDTEQEIDEEIDSSEEFEYSDTVFIGKDKITKWNKHQSKKSVRLGRENIIKEVPGVQGIAKEMKNPLEIWSCFFDDEMLCTIVNCTNKKINTISGNSSRERDAKVTDIPEIKALLGLLYLAGVRHANHLNIYDLWKVNGTGIEAFRLTMNIQRFRFLLRNITFDDIETREQRRTTDKLALIRYFVEKFNENSKKYYTHSEYVTVDEKLEAFRGRCGFRQYIPSKPNKYGIKIFALSDAKFYYTSHIEVYVGEQPEGPFRKDNSGKSIVERLSEHIYESGRNITVDNWFTSLPLAKSLKEKRLSILGTIRKNKKELPLDFVVRGSRPIGSSMFGFGEYCTLLSYLPKKNKNILLISSMHRDDVIDESCGKPEIIVDYNKSKGGVDVVDKLCAQYNCARNTRRWPMVVFYSLLNMAAINSNIIYLSNNKEIKPNRRHFLENLSAELLLDYQKQRVLSKFIPQSIKVRLEEICNIGKEEATQAKINPTESGRCSQCSWKKNRKTRYSCKCCGAFLCLAEHSIIICEKCSMKLQ